MDEIASRGLHAISAEVQAGVGRDIGMQADVVANQLVGAALGL